MAKLLLTILHFLSDKLRALIVIIAVLLVGVWLQHEWQALEQAQQNTAHQQQVKALLQARHQELVKAQQQAEKLSQQLLAAFEQQKKQLNHLQTQLQQLHANRQALWDDNWFARKNPLSETSQQLREYDLQIAAFTTQLRLSQQAYNLWQNKVNQSADVAKNRQLQQQLQQSQQVLNQLTSAISESESVVRTSMVNRLRTAVMQVLPSAIFLLMAVIFVPIFFKLFQYFVVAPIVSKLPAITILPIDSTQTQDITIASSSSQEGHVSAHSLRLILPPEQELLLHPDYLQSFSKLAQKSTQWFLNASIPLSSWAAGLVTLVRLQSNQTETVQLASMRNPLEELVIIDLPVGATLVCKPRCLAGVIKQRGEDVHISRHWRLFNLHSWLTLQLRYLVFHGACQLIIKGDHGVILEHAGQARLIQQNATLGFSTDVAYSNYRCETFISYYLGKDNLFNDQFSGPTGVYFYEQAPHDDRKAALVGKVVGGFWDAVRKVFGI